MVVAHVALTPHLDSYPQCGKKTQIESFNWELIGRNQCLLRNHSALKKVLIETNRNVVKQRRIISIFTDTNGLCLCVQSKIPFVCLRPSKTV